MDFRQSGLSSGTLPGAWSSSWTLSDGARNWTEPPRRLSENKPLQDQENENLAFLGIPSSKGRVVPHSVDTNVCGYVNSDSSLSDEESVLSDDFYSFISQEDPDITLSPSVATPLKHAENIFCPDAPAEPDFLTGLNSSLHLPKQQDVAFPNDVLATLSAPPFPHSSEPSFEAPYSSSSCIFQPDSSSSQAASVTDPDDHSERASIHSNYSGLNYASVCHLIDRLDSRFAPPDSSDCNNTLLFSQPDGNNPWTLSLEPALSFMESGLSATSLSMESSSASEDGCPSEICQQQPELVPFEAYSPSLDNPPIVNDEAETLYDRRSARRFSVEALPPQRRSINPQSSHLTIGHRNESIRSRNVLQKTKEFCRKFKRFIASKSPKSRSDNNSLLPPGAYTVVDVDTQLAQGYNFPRPASEVSSRGRRFMRSAKISSPSVALSEYPNYHSGSAADDIHSYDYHARPKTLQEIKSRRRFSLPAFSGPSASARANRVVASERMGGRMG